MTNKHKGVVITKITPLLAFVAITFVMLAPPLVGNGQVVTTAYSESYSSPDQIPGPNILKIFNLTAQDFSPPLPLTNERMSDNTVVSFKLDEENFVSILSTEKGFDVIVWSKYGKSCVYASVEEPSDSWNETRSFTEGEGILMTALQADIFTIPLPASTKDGDASTLSTQMISASYMIEYWGPISPSSPIFQIMWGSRAGGDFYYVYDEEVTGIYPGNSGAWITTIGAACGWIQCQATTLTAGVHEAVGYIQENSGFAIGCITPVQHAAWPNVGVDLWGNIKYPSQTPHTSWWLIGCGCVPWQPQFPPIP